MHVRVHSANSHRARSQTRGHIQSRDCPSLTTNTIYRGAPVTQRSRSTTSTETLQNPAQSKIAESSSSAMLPETPKPARRLPATHTYTWSETHADRTLLSACWRGCVDWLRATTLCNSVSLIYGRQGPHQDRDQYRTFTTLFGLLRALAFLLLRPSLPFIFDESEEPVGLAIPYIKHHVQKTLATKITPNPTKGSHPRQADRTPHIQSGHIFVACYKETQC